MEQEGVEMCSLSQSLVHSSQSGLVLQAADTRCIKETPPTAAPDNLSLRGKKALWSVPVVICITCQRGYFSAEAVFNLQLSYSPSLLHQIYELTQIVTLLFAGSMLCDPRGFFSWKCKLSLYWRLAVVVISDYK